MSIFFLHHVRACCHRASTLLQNCKHSATQHTAISPHEASKYVLIRVRQRKQADREHLLYCITASTAQHSAISPHKAEKQVRADQSATTQASGQSWRSQHVIENLNSTLSYQNEGRNRNKSARPTKIYNFSHSAGVMREGFACSSDINKMQRCSFSPSFLCISYIHVASELLSWSMELWTFVSRQFAPKVVDLSDLIRI